MVNKHKNLLIIISERVERNISGFQRTPAWNVLPASATTASSYLMFPDKLTT